MSTIPKARESTIVDVTITPNGWDDHPEISKSNIANCTFKDLNSATKIDRTELSQSIIQPSSTKKGAHIERSQVHNCQVFSARIGRSELHHSTVTDSFIERSKLENCSVEPPCNIQRTKARSTKFINAKRVERAELDSSVVLGESILERCIIRDSVIADKAHCERSEFDNTTVTRSRIERSKITDCDVMDCSIERTDFQGMILKYGIWKKGDLVGRTSTEHEVVIKKRPASVPAAEPSAPSPMEPIQTPGLGWKAAEAAREASRGQAENEEEDDSASDLESSTDDETFDPSPKPTKQSQTGHYTSTPTSFTADAHDPPPPYQQ